MTITPGKPVLLVLGCLVALVLVAFTAICLIGNSPDQRARGASETTIGTAAAASTPKPKERVRYQATIENWRKYRAASGPN